MWHSWNVDRMYMGGVQIKHRAHAGLNHQKSVILYDQNGSLAGDQSMAIFGSSNWTSPSASGQVEHNVFSTKPDIVSWFVNQFERKWNNTGGMPETVDFVPLPPDAPKNPVPAIGASGIAIALTLKWYGGPWAHLYDLYLDTNPAFPAGPIAANLAERIELCPLIRPDLFIVHHTRNGQASLGLSTDDVTQLIGGKRIGEKEDAFLGAFQQRDERSLDAVIWRKINVESCAVENPVDGRGKRGPTAALLVERLGSHRRESVVLPVRAFLGRHDAYAYARLATGHALTSS